MRKVNCKVFNNRKQQIQKIKKIKKTIAFYLKCSIIYIEKSKKVKVKQGEDMRISDIITQFIEDMIDEDEGETIIQRNDLAEHFNCVPSQINYVISTRFTPIQGYYVESQRGGGGFIKIQKVKIDANKYIMHVINCIGKSITAREVDVFIDNFFNMGVIDEKDARLLKSATSDKCLIEAKENKDFIRAKILKNMLINLV